MGLSFKVSKSDRELINKIADRAISEIFSKHPTLRVDRLDVQMDISALIAQGVPLRLDELLVADTFNFNHDIWGIVRNLNRKTGKLENFFVPRFIK